jgi:hypothetical protein
VYIVTVNSIGKIDTVILAYEVILLSFENKKVLLES